MIASSAERYGTLSRERFSPLTLNGHCDNPDAVSRKAAPIWVLPGFEQPELADDQMCA
jgi:hypothetical protein